jgi:hypothetical protein
MAVTNPSRDPGTANSGEPDAMSKPTRPVLLAGTSIASTYVEDVEKGVREKLDAVAAHAVQFSPEVYAQLETLATVREQTPAEYVRDAIGLARWVDEILHDGGSMVVRHKHRPWEVLRAKRR